MKRVFIVGRGRSGTTLLQSMMAAHSQIYSTSSTNTICDIVGQFQKRTFGRTALTLREKIIDSLQDLRIGLGFCSKKCHSRIKSSQKHPEFSERLDFFLDGYQGSSLKIMIAAFVQAMDSLAVRHEKTLWVEKTALNIGYIDVIERFVPDAQFIHLTRPGCDTVASIFDLVQKHDRWRETYSNSLDRCLDSWVNAVRATQFHCKKQNHRSFLYQDLVSDPEAILMAMCQFVGTEFSTQMIENSVAAATQIVIGNQPWKNGVFTALDKKVESKFTKILSAAQQKAVLQRLESENLVDLTSLRS